MQTQFKKALLFFFAAGIAALALTIANMPLNGTTGFAPLTGAGSGLMGYWTFDEGSGATATDSSGIGNNGTLNGGSVWVSAAGAKIGSGAIQFDGIDDFASFSSEIMPIGSSARTVSFWAKVNNDGFLISQGNNSAARAWGIQIDGTYFMVWHHSGDVRAAHGIGDIGTWNLYTYVYPEGGNNDDAKLYVNGVFASDFGVYAGQARALNTGSSVPRMGAVSVDTPSEAEFFQGTVDDVRIYSRALTDSEVQELHSSASGTQPPVNGQCGLARNTCNAGILNDTADTQTQYNWQCTGLNGGTSAGCSAPITSNLPPTIAITSPANGASYPAPATVTIGASATDIDGSIAKVDFYSGATLLGTDTTSPYSYSWVNAPAGNYSITATATDNQGATASSTSVNVSVSGSAPPPIQSGNGPTISIADVVMAPNSTVTVPLTISDPDTPASNITLTLEVDEGSNALIWNNDVTIQGTGANRQLTIKHEGQYTASKVIYIHASDGTNKSYNLVVVTVIAPAPASTPRTLTVKPGDPSAFQSIQACADEAGPGDTCIVRAGTYTGTVVTKDNGQPGRYITFKAAPGEIVVIDGQDQLYTAFEINHQFIRVEGFEITGYGAAIDMESVRYLWSPYSIPLVHHIQIVGNKIHDIGKGVHMRKVVNVHIENNEIYNTYDTAISLNAVNAIIRGNHVHHGDVDGIANEALGLTIIENNSIHDFTSTENHGDGIQILGWDTLIVRNNIFYNSTQNMFLESYCGTIGACGKSGKAYVYNNIAINPDPTSQPNGMGGWFNGLIVASNKKGVEAVRFYNNTLINLNSGNGGISVGGRNTFINGEYAMGIVDLRNNLFFNSTNPNISGCETSGILMTDNCIVENNLYYNPARKMFTDVETYQPR